MRRLFRLLCALWLLCPLVAHAATYYVAKTGNNSTSCANATSPTTPRLTITAGAQCLTAGDTLLVKPGTYAEVLNNVFPSGTAGDHTIVRSETPLAAIIKPTGNTQLISGKSITVFNNRQYITFDGFVSDGANLHKVYHVYLQGTSNNLLFQNNEIKNGTSADQFENTMGFVDNHGPHHITIKNNHIHHMGSNAPGNFSEPVPGNGMYLHINDSIIEGNHIHNCATYGIHNYNTVSGANNRNIIRNNTIHHNGSRGILVSGGADNVIHNNIVYQNGLFVDTQAVQIGGYGGLGGAYTTGNKVWHNTIWANPGQCIRLGATTFPINTTVQNNICYQNTPDTIGITGTTGSVVNNNLLGTNPLFVNAAQADFHLQPTSPGINAGVMIPGLTYVNGRPYMGALEPGVETEPPPPIENPMTIYVSTSGVDTNPCATTDTLVNARRTIPGGLACLTKPGAALVIKGGTYTEQISTLTTPIAAGTSTAVRTTIRAFENAGVPETVILQLPASGGSARMLSLTNATNQWLHVKNLEITCQDRSSSYGVEVSGGTRRVRLENLNIHNCAAGAILLGQNADEVEVLGGTLSTPGNTTHPHVYLSASINNVTIRGVTLQDAMGGTRTCIHATSLTQAGGLHSGLLIEKNRFINCETALYLGNGSGARVQNNLIYGGSIGIDVLSGLINSVFYHNTIVDHSVVGLRCNTGASGIQVRNSILFDNTANLTNTCGASVLNTLEGVDPTFTNAASQDYTLQNTSVAIDAGIVLPGVTDDFLGVDRSTYGVAPDIGAYESTADPPEPEPGPDPDPGPASLRAPRRLTSGFFTR